MSGIGSRSLQTNLPLSELPNNDEDKYNHPRENLKLLSEASMPAAALMERTKVSLGFFQNILKTESSPALQIAWNFLLRELKNDLSDVEEQMVLWQRKCQLKDKQLVDTNAVCEELQNQIEKDKTSSMAQEREANSQVANGLRNRVSQLEEELHETMEMKNDLMNKFNTLFRKKRTAKLKIEQLAQEVEDLSHELEVQQDVIAKLKQALNASKTELEVECNKSYQEGLKFGRHLATLEEIGVLEQFRILKDIEETLTLRSKCDNRKRTITALNGDSFGS